MEDKTFLDENLEILDILLCDRTTKKNIVWATNNYEKRGYKEQDNIKSNIKKRFYKAIVNYKDSNPKMYYEELCNYYENN